MSSDIGEVIEGLTPDIIEKNLHLLGKQNSPKAYRNDIDGLRAVAIVSVVLFHAGALILAGGFVGVDVFFVISGYLIGAHIYQEVCEGRFSLTRFYQRRAKRILPALFLLLAFCYLTSIVLLSPAELKSFGGYAVSSVFSVSNVFAWFKSDYFATKAELTPLLMTWSLGVEEHFYIFFPLLILPFARVLKQNKSQFRIKFFWIIFAGTLFSLGLSVVGTMTYQTAAFYLLPTRAWELSLGVLMAIYEARPKDEAQDTPLYGGHRWSDLRSLAGSAAILFAVLHYGSVTPFPGMASVPPVLGAAFIISAPGAWLNRRVLSSKPFRWIGLVSYSWYLWHWPILSFARICADRQIATSISLLLTVLALGLASLSYRFVEQPFRRSKMPAAPLLRRYAIASLLFALPGVAMEMAHGFPRRYPSLAAQEDQIRDQGQPCFGTNVPVTTQQCVPAPDGRPAIALMGDSHAEMISAQIRRLANASGLRLYTLTHTQCPPLLGVVSASLTGDPMGIRECLKYNEAALKLVATDPSVDTVLLAGFWAAPSELAPKGAGYARDGRRGVVTPEENEENMEFGLNAMVSALRSAGKRVIILQDDETFRFDPLRRVRAYFIPARSWIGQHLQARVTDPGQAATNEMYTKENEAAAKIVARVAKQNGAEIFDLRNRLCTNSTCLFYADGKLLYHDANHLTPVGAELALHGFPIP